jgi:hypothetical protein
VTVYVNRSRIKIGFNIIAVVLILQTDPRMARIVHSTVPSPTTLASELSPFNPYTAQGCIDPTKLATFGVTETETPESITIGSSC